MATNSSLKNQLIEKGQSVVNVQETMFKNLINSEDVKVKFTEVLKDKAPMYMESIINLVNGDKYIMETPTSDVVGVSDSHKKQVFGSLLIECEPYSIIDACMIAASLDLSVDKNLEYIWIIPYKKKANFGLGYKGYIQLLLRAGEYKAINVIEVYEGQLKSWDPLSEEFDIDVNSKKSDVIIGYAGYFEMLNGFRKSVYWSKENMDLLRNNSFKSDSRWNSDYKAMAKKMVMRNMISKWGSLSSEMQKAYSEDLNTDKFINGN
ncbi:recombinase RecT [Clostridium chromiireducens]|uniref:Recombinase RecT n=1 Tax=Clostridium chromiireducens TaxID=225345 RepID=A0A964RJJ3_9CLOT|nr:recombinase RecT [Clostridium chromiireducens]MVX62686.1 recombinase RecT [Clostridium chromiireducens]